MRLPTLKCERCLHQWFPRIPSLPVRCPKCKSPYWNKPRKGPRAKELKRLRLLRYRSAEITEKDVTEPMKEAAKRVPLDFNTK